MLHERLRSEAVLEPLRAAWREQGKLRIEQVFDEASARAALEALRAQPHHLAISPDPAFAYQYWRFAWTPEPECDHVLCSLGRWIHAEALALARDLTGIDLGPGPDAVLWSALFSKGSYLDSHNDYGKDRAVAYVLGLTEASWSPGQGGHLEFLDGLRGEVIERRPPGWNTLDLFDVRTPQVWHQVPLVRDHVERRTITGWFYPAT